MRGWGKKVSLITIMADSIASGMGEANPIVVCGGGLSRGESIEGERLEGESIEGESIGKMFNFILLSTCGHC